MSLPQMSTWIQVTMPTTTTFKKGRRVCSQRVTMRESCKFNLPDRLIFNSSPRMVTWATTAPHTLQGRTKQPGTLGFLESCPVYRLRSRRRRRFSVVRWFLLHCRNISLIGQHVSSDAALGLVKVVLVLVVGVLYPQSIYGRITEVHTEIRLYSISAGLLFS